MDNEENEGPMEKKLRVGVLGATGMVGQRFISLLENNPWYEVVKVAASTRSAGRTYEEAVGDRWARSTPRPESMKNRGIFDATADVEKIASMVDFVFCAVNMKKDEIKALEEAYAKAECPVMSNNSANRGTPDVPMIIPENNADHAAVLDAQRKRLGTCLLYTSFHYQRKMPCLRGTCGDGKLRFQDCT